MKKLISIFMLIIIVLMSFKNISFGIAEISSATVSYSHDTGYHLQYWKSSINDWSYVKTSYIEYEYNGKRYPAYCANRDRMGAEVAGSYDVNILDYLEDNRIWRVVINGYPYKSAIQMGVENDDDAFVATKHAIYSILYDIDVRSYYRGGDERGVKIVDAIDRLVNIGRNGTEEYRQIDMRVHKTSEFKEDEIDPNYCSQRFIIDCPVNMELFNVRLLDGFTENTKIVDLNNNERQVFPANEEFKVMIPKSELIYDINLTIGVDAKCETYPVFYGDSNNEQLQDYILSFDKYGYVSSIFQINIDVYKSGITIIKKDKEKNTPIKDVKFEVFYENGEKIGEYKTNEEGEININGLKPGKIIIKEIETNEAYILDSTPKEVVLEYNKNYTLEIFNERKKGSLKLIKVDKDNNNIRLPNVEFELIDSRGNIVQRFKTDSNGEAVINNIDIGKYVLKETKTNSLYKICADKNVTVEWNKLIEVQIENEKKKGKIEIYKVDLDDNTYGIKGVEFIVMNEKDEVVEKLITNEKGYAVTSRLPIGNYTIKETKTDEKYVLNDDIVKVEVKEDKTSKLQIENEKKKGQIEVYKVDKDNNKYKIKDVEFVVINDEGEIVESLITNEDGYAITSRLPIGNYTIKETKANEKYVLNEEVVKVEIKEDKISKLQIENEKKKGQIQIHKVDADNNEYGIKNVEFVIMNEEGEVIETLITDEKGNAITSRLPIGKYTIKETRTNVNYILKDEIVEIEVKQDEISNIQIENKKIKKMIIIKELPKTGM